MLHKRYDKYDLVMWIFFGLFAGAIITLILVSGSPNYMLEQLELKEIPNVLEDVCPVPIVICPDNNVTVIIEGCCPYPPCDNEATSTPWTITPSWTPTGSPYPTLTPSPGVTNTLSPTPTRPVATATRAPSTATLVQTPTITTTMETTTPTATVSPTPSKTEVPVTATPTGMVCPIPGEKAYQWLIHKPGTPAEQCYPCDSDRCIRGHLWRGHRETGDYCIAPINSPYCLTEFPDKRDTR